MSVSKLTHGPGDMQIFIKMPSGDKLNLQYTGLFPMRFLKAMIQEATGTHPAQQRLHLAGQELEGNILPSMDGAIVDLTCVPVTRTQTRNQRRQKKRNEQEAASSSTDVPAQGPSSASADELPGPDLQGQTAQQKQAAAWKAELEDLEVARKALFDEIPFDTMVPAVKQGAARMVHRTVFLERRLGLPHL